MRTFKTVLLKNSNRFKKKLLYWSQQYNEVAWLDSNNHNQKFSQFDAVLAVNASNKLSCNANNAFNRLKTFHNKTNDWLFGYLSYDLKNDIEDLESSNHDGLCFPELYFFQPKKLFLIKGNRLTMAYLDSCRKDMKSDFKAIKKTDISEGKHHRNSIKIKLRIHKEDYFKKIETILEHIYRGDIYETNFCQEFYAENTVLNPLHTYYKLNTISKPPFATFLKFDDKYLLSASPERYLKKNGNSVVSQPIKGTAKRSENPEEDRFLKSALLSDEKERSENIMIVDLVRNDLSKTAIKGTVKVDELCKVYSFKQVHQMISTISSEITESTHPVDVIKTTFPMGSMTGAPKISAMKIIENLEETKRGLYSGAVGYFAPNGDFDFNVVIRSILYNVKTKYVSYSVGGAITAKSEPQKEYEECLVKAKAMREVLEN